ncbi:hypothetical protein [Leyella stercorea]|uniref:hypothetical protein n=1 Tax=Leyella stercorea TaxID=363265 RepID=UPI001A49834A|nr:hypothetical protein [Leyella stercorea]MBL6518207.1 hypothetical protein [Leyella stercorea]
MKKIFTLLVLLMTTLCVSAQQYYKGTFHSKVGDFNDYETTVAVTQGEGGKYTLVFESIIFGNDDFGKCTFAGLENYKWAGNGSFTFSNEGGNLGAATKSYFELSDALGKATIDDEKIYLTFRYFQVNTTKEYMNVVFEGTRTSSGGGGGTGGDDKPTITATEQFTAGVASEFQGGQSGVVKYPNVVAKVCEWSDGAQSIEIAHIDTEKGVMSGVLLKGLEKKTVDGEVTYTGVVEPEIETLPNFYDTYVNLKANVEARIDEGGDLYATIVFTDESEPSFKLTAWFNYQEPFVPADPFSVGGKLVGYTVTADGEFSNNVETTLTFTETAKDVYTLSLTNVAIPDGVALGTVSFEGVQRTGSDSEASFTSKKGKAKTTATHPLYTELPYTDFEFVVGFDAEKKVTSCTGKFVVDNWDEAVSYTFSFTPTETSVNTVVAADGTVKHIYTLTGAKVTSLQRGVNIVRTADGRTLKVLKK